MKDKYAIRQDSHAEFIGRREEREGEIERETMSRFLREEGVGGACLLKGQGTVCHAQNCAMPGSQGARLKCAWMLTLVSTCGTQTGTQAKYHTHKITKNTYSNCWMQRQINL